jgi:hypothetical protein
MSYIMEADLGLHISESTQASENGPVLHLPDLKQVLMKLMLRANYKIPI